MKKLGKRSTVPGAEHMMPVEVPMRRGVPCAFPLVPGGYGLVGGYLPAGKPKEQAEEFLALCESFQDMRNLHRLLEIGSIQDLAWYAWELPEGEDGWETIPLDGLEEDGTR